MSSSAPTHIGKYRIVDLLGEGAMGIVYRAEDTVLARPVAVKVMSEAIAREGDLRDRFLREARAAGSLQHPHVVTIYDFGEVDGHLFIAMEYVEGVDLAQLLARGEPPPPDAALAVVGDVLSGLAYAHKRGVVHRDIKPANVRVTEEGRGKIMDFGIAHVASSELTRTGLALGTPSYMAPEQVTGGPVSPATDLFAVGVMLYELLSGVKPFAGPTLHSILYKIVSEEPADLLAVAPHVPPALGRVVHRALQKDPEARYAAALDMAADLAAVRAAGGAGPGTLSLRVPGFVAPGEGAREGAREGAGVGVTNAGAPRAGGTEVTTSAASAPAAPTPAANPHATYRGLWVGTGVAACLVVGVAVWAARGGAPTTAAPTALASAPAGAGAAAPAVASAPPPAAAPEAPSASPGQASAPPTPPAANAGVRVAPPTAPAVAPGARAAHTPTPAPPPPTVAAPATPTGVGSVTPTAPASGPSAGAGALTTTDRPPAAPTPDAGASDAAPASADVAEAAQAYARAIESRDLGAVRRAYPGISDAQEGGFRQFFDAARGLRVTFAVRGVEVAGATAEARLTGTYEYVTADGQRHRDPVDFAATFRRQGGAWRLSAVR